MKRYLILSSYEPIQLREDIALIKNNIDLDKFSLMSSIMFSEQFSGIEVLSMLVAARQGIIITEPNKKQIVFGLAKQEEKFDEVLVIREESLVLQERFLEGFIGDLRTEFYSTLNGTKFFKDEFELLEYLQNL